MEQHTKFYHLNSTACIVVIAGMAFVLRLLIGMCYYNTFDLGSYNIPWAIGVRDGLFSAYSRLENLDYPPMFPFLLSFLGGAVEYAKNSNASQLLMLFIKLVPIVFDTAIVVVLYFVGLRYSQTLALLLSAVWALNPSSILNCAMWGQTDSMLLLFAGLTFLAFYDKRPAYACSFFALGCLAKLQMAYFAPVLLCELFFCYRPKRALSSLGIGVGIGLLGWLPFMIGSRDVFLPFRIYFGGFNSYNYINLNAYNIYGLSDNNWVTDTRSVLGGTYSAQFGVNVGGFTYSHWSTLLTVALLAVLVFSYYYAYKQKIEVPAVLPALFFMNSIFMVTVKMHERYQMPVLILCLLCFVLCRDKRFFYTFLGFVAVTLCNQGMLLFSKNFGGIFNETFDVVQQIGSAVNVALYVVMLYLYIEYYVKTPKQDAEEQSI